MVELVRNLVAHGDAREGKWRWNWRMEWVASTLTRPPNVVSIHHYYRWCAHLGCQQSTELTPPTDLNGLVPFGGKTKSGFCACAITFRTSYTCCFGLQVVGLVWGCRLCVRFAGCCSVPQTGHITYSSRKVGKTTSAQLNIHQSSCHLTLIIITI